MDIDAALLLTSGGFSLAGVPFKQVTYRKLLTSLKTISLVTSEVESAMSRFSVALDADYEKDDAKNEATAVMYQWMLATAPRYFFSDEKKRYMQTVCRLGGGVTTDVIELIHAVKYDRYFIFSESVWKGGPSLGEIKKWIAMSVSSKPQPVDPRIARKGDLAQSTLFELSRPKIERKPVKRKWDVKWMKTPDFLKMYWKDEYLAKTDEMTKEIKDVLPSVSNVWLEFESNAILKVIMDYPNWKMDKKIEMQKLLDKIDTLVQNELRRREKKPEPIIDKKMSFEEMMFELVGIMKEYKTKGKPDFGALIAEDTLIQLGLSPTLLRNHEWWK